MPKRFLISRLSALGDTVCSLPAAVALKGTFPDCHITWAVDPRFAGIVSCCRAVDEVIVAKPALKPSTWPRYAERFDATLDLQGLLKSALCVAFAKADRKVGYHWQREGAWFFSERILPDPSSFHIVDQYVDVARELGADMDRARFELHPLEEDLASVQTKLKQRGIEDRFVVVNAGAGWVTKRWPVPSFAALIKTIGSEGYRSVLIGGKAQTDRDVAAAVIAEAGPAAVDLTGETSVRELVALIKLSSAHIGGDTGSTHIAAALDTPAIGLYSITNPRRSCPYGQFERCHYDSVSLANIPPESVLESVHSALKASSNIGLLP